MIYLKSRKEIEIMKEGGRLLAEIMRRVSKLIKPGLNPLYLDKIVERMIKKYGEPSFKGYENFPNACCICINDELAHCLPKNFPLKEGDIVSVDIGLKYKGFHNDMARTFPVGKVNFLAQRLIRVGKEVLKLAIKKAKAGRRIGEISNIIERYTLSQGFSPIRDLSGHGIGKKLHEDPKILNFGKRNSGVILKEGMVICIEPMISAGGWKIAKSEDGFGFKMRDGSLCVHFEDTVAILKNGPLVLTK